MKYRCVRDMSGRGCEEEELEQNKDEAWKDRMAVDCCGWPV